ncbi:ankyrin repeat domain-containing protein [Pedobacter sp. Hv1]|uniref:ankyrin repeat domain-containing protein n=1 Tax=Pedobacter sp. Hv1 TaxID=1740090 RepID=UPI0006D8BBE5|nr:ankyrin repeat domain-containing protein [Pedobacter sp. Hv1]KQC02191.1 hypothetical protein AQF98_01045 [Pedobacter sp. Hv1]
MLKKDIKAFFKAIRAGDFKTIEQSIALDHAYLAVTNFAPPKMDDGQSALQVAFRAGQFEICEFLIKKGADVNFKESSVINEWTAPMLHDCIRAVVFNCLTIQADQNKFEQAFELLILLLKNGANPNATDSYGNNCLNRWCLDARQMIHHPNFNENEAIINQLRRVSMALINAGAYTIQSAENRTNVIEQIKSYSMEKYNLLQSPPAANSGLTKLTGGLLNLFKSSKK